MSSSRRSALPTSLPAPDAPVTVVPAPQGVRVFGAAYQFAVLSLTTLIFLGSVLLLWVFGFTFWALLETLVRITGWQQGSSLFAPLLSLLTQQVSLTSSDGWPLDVAIVLATLATWGFLYLAFDALAMYGNRKAQIVLLDKAKAAVTAPLPPAFFVELRATDKTVRLQPDVGCLLLYPDRLDFIGDSQTVTIPRDSIVGGPFVQHSFARLAASSVLLELPDAFGFLRLLNRDEATRLSDTADTADALSAALLRWRNGPAVTIGIE